MAFHHSVLDEFGIDSTMEQERALLVNLAIDYLQDNHKLTLSRHYTILKKEITIKGKLQVAQKSLTSKINKDDEFENELAELEKTFGPMTAGCKDTLLNQLSNITVDDEPSFMTTDSNTSDIKLPGDTVPKKMGLIQELGTGEFKLRTPEHEFTEKEDANGKQKLVLKIRLPKVLSVNECELDLSPVDIILYIHVIMYTSLISLK